MPQNQSQKHGTANKWTKRTSLFLALFLLLYGCYAVASNPAAPNQREAEQLVVHFIDVGQGDATLLLLPGGKNMLIDAGDNPTGNQVIRYIQDQGVKTIDYVVATHPHADHIGGMDKVINTFSIGEFYMPRLPDSQLPTTRTFEDMLLALDSQDIRPKQAKAGTEILSDDGLSIEILAPVKAEYKDLNHYSAVVKVTYGRRSFLFLGDAEKQNENEMIEKGFDLRADVLKCGHHGSRNASSAKFLGAVSPEYAVISCGQDNTYGHPHEETLNRLKKTGAEIYRTDEQSNIIFFTDGTDMNVQTAA